MQDGDATQPGSSYYNTRICDYISKYPTRLCCVLSCVPSWLNTLFPCITSCGHTLGWPFMTLGICSFCTFLFFSFSDFCQLIRTNLSTAQFLSNAPFFISYLSRL
ncbi:hypothetical protein RvY_03343 [Ramazzottius varieornatus]|uniref:Uncharacterized protein n=1 Tax=Ramazzottius varieornatus TaxID=947166 RepID=A0A1D1URH9_RAMVA|nr:hypothetical protein RvY_03343 [Ramazzottius varieornatus]